MNDGLAVGKAVIISFVESFQNLLKYDSILRYQETFSLVG